MNTARTARGNRLGLALTGLVLLIGGGYLIWLLHRRRAP